MTNLTQQEREWCEGKPKRKKPRKRTVFVLEAIVHYESSTVSGVYSTKRRAEKAQAALEALKGYQPDEYSITPHVVDV